jgi:hypothetical protein
MVNTISGGRRVPRTPAIMNEMAARISATARQNVRAFCAEGAAVPASTILAQKAQHIVSHTIKTMEEDGNVKFWGGYDKLETVPDWMLLNTLKIFTPQKLFRMSAFTEVLRCEREAGADWRYENSIRGDNPMSIFALMFKGSIFYRNFDGTGASLFNYDREPGKEPLIEEQPFIGSIEGSVSLGRMAMVRISEKNGAQTNTFFQLAGLKVNGPEDIDVAKEAYELLTLVLALNDL